MEAFAEAKPQARKRAHALANRDLLSGNFKSLQALRAVAAVAVVLFHANHSFFGTTKYWPDQPFGRVFEFGHAGVEIFFVLSGFIIYAAHRHDIGDRTSLGTYLWKRFRRVYPVYWIILGLVLPLYFVSPSIGNGSESSPELIADSVMLVHVFRDSQILLVSWTLFHEIAFYAVFSLAVLDRRVGSAAIGAWLAASFVALCVPSAVPHSLSFLVSPLHLLFGMGMATAWILRRRRLPMAGLALAAGVVMFAAGAAADVLGIDWPAELLSMLYGLGGASIIAGAVELERSGRLRVPAWLVFLGDASYSLYLVHVVVMSAIAKAALALLSRYPLPHSVVFIALAVGATTAGLVFHVVAEKPVLALLGQVKFAPGRPKAVARLS